MRQRLLHDGLLIVAVAAWSLAAPWTSPARADSAQVTIAAPGGAQQTLSLDALGGGDVVERAYALRAGEGETALTLTGFSPAAILDAAGIDSYGFSYLEVQRPGGGSVLLSRHQALDPGAFPEGPPVIYATATGTGFLRPSNGTRDLNAADSFEAPQGVSLVLREGSPLRVRAQASTLRTRPGRPVTFTAAIDRAGAGEQLAYSWYFDDGTSSTGPRTRHRFAKRGSYDVVVGVTTPGDDTGASAVVTVQVGPPLGGPDRKGGGRNRAATAPDHGAASGGDGAAPAAASSGSDAAPAVPSDAPAAEPQPRPRSHPEPAPPEGREVSGQLLTGTRAPQPKPAAPAARSGSLEQQGSGGGLPGAALGIAVAAGLLGAGALTELRR